MKRFPGHTNPPPPPPKPGTMKKILIFEDPFNDIPSAGVASVKIGLRRHESFLFTEYTPPPELNDTIWALEYFNKWRRSNEDSPMPNPKEIGIALDRAIEILKQLK